MTDAERIESLERDVRRLEMVVRALTGGARGAFSFDSEGKVVTICNYSPNQHHYPMPSGQCSCQDWTWAK